MPALLVGGGGVGADGAHHLHLKEEVFQAGAAKHGDVRRSGRAPGEKDSDSIEAVDGEGGVSSYRSIAA